MDYSQQFNYLSFLVEKTNQQVKMERFINEAVLIGEGANTLGNIQIIQESFSESVKKVINKLLTFIGKMWGKFIEAMNVLIKNDVAYLERYKDIILKKKQVNDVIIYDYYAGGIQLLLNSTVPSLQDNDINGADGQSVLDDKDKFIKAKFGNYTKYGKGPYEELTELATTAFRSGGQEVTKAAGSLNMTDMYNYCHDYQSLKSKIERDINTVNTAQTNFTKKLNDMTNAGKLTNNSSGNGEGQGTTVNTSESFSFDDKYYSAVYETYISEADNNGNNQPNWTAGRPTTNQPKDGQPQQQNDQNANNQNNNQNNNNNQNVNNTNPSAHYQATDKKDADANVNEKQEYDILQKRATVYFEICGQFLAAKLSVAQEIEKKFMNVIKAHVRHYVGDDKKDDNTAGNAPTNLNSNNGNNNQQQQSDTNNDNAIADAAKQAQEDK